MGSCMQTNKDTSKAKEIRPAENLRASGGVNGDYPPALGLDLNVDAATFVKERKNNIKDEYNFLSPPLGSGAFGEVHKATHKLTGLTRAIKTISKAAASKEDQERLINEVEILKQLDHPNIIKIYEFFQDDKFFYIVSELCVGGELFDKIIEKKFFTERMAADVMRQILSAIHYCHNHKIVHRDLKPENILYESKKDDSPIKVIDFGTSRTFDPNEKMTQKFGTPYYIAPEVLKRTYDQKCDIWSCGVITYILLCGYPPFNGASDRLIMEKVARGSYVMEGPEWNVVSDKAKAFIRACLKKDTTTRYSALEALNDPWIQTASTQIELSKPVVSSAYQNLQTFRADRKLAQATWSYLVGLMASKEEKADLLKLFKTLDLNNDGLLSREELIQGYKNHFRSANPEAEVTAIMNAIDTNKSGAIDYSEFVMATINRQALLSKERLETVFKMFDKDGSGTISADEIKEFFGNAKTNEDPELWKKIIKEVDQNGDGTISFKEFKEMMLRLI